MSPDVLITIKLQVGDENRRFKLPLRDLGANTLPDKVRVVSLLSIGSLVQRSSDNCRRLDGCRIYRPVCLRTLTDIRLHSFVPSSQSRRPRMSSSNATRTVPEITSRSTAPTLRCISSCIGPRKRSSSFASGQQSSMPQHQKWMLRSQNLSHRTSSRLTAMCLP